jgi:hypothetical protein
MALCPGRNSAVTTFSPPVIKENLMLDRGLNLRLPGNLTFLAGKSRWRVSLCPASGRAQSEQRLLELLEIIDASVRSNCRRLSITPGPTPDHPVAMIRFLAFSVALNHASPYHLPFTGFHFHLSRYEPVSIEVRVW